MAAKIKTGDNVIVLTGRDKGKKGTVLRLDTKRNRAINLPQIQKLWPCARTNGTA